jgi:hypothetical protein
LPTEKESAGAVDGTAAGRPTRRAVGGEKREKRIKSERRTEVKAHCRSREWVRQESTRGKEFSPDSWFKKLFIIDRNKFDAGKKNY